MQLGLAHRGPPEPRRVRVLALGEAILEALEERRIRSGGALIERLPHDLHARPEHHAAVDGVTEIDGAVAAARIHVEDGGEAGLEIGLRVGHRDDGSRGLGEIVRWIDVDVPVDHPGHDCGRTEIDDARVRGNRDRWTDVGDAVAANQDDLIRQHRPRAAVEQTTGADRHDLRRRDEKLRRRAGNAALAVHRRGEAQREECCDRVFA